MLINLVKIILFCVSFTLTKLQMVLEPYLT